MFFSQIIRSSTRKTKDVVVAAAPTSVKHPHRNYSPKFNFHKYSPSSIDILPAPPKAIDSGHFHSMYGSDLKYQPSLRSFFFKISIINFDY